MKSKVYNKEYTHRVVNVNRDNIVFFGNWREGDECLILNSYQTNPKALYYVVEIWNDKRGSQLAWNYQIEEIKDNYEINDDWKPYYNFIENKLIKELGMKPESRYGITGQLEDYGINKVLSQKIYSSFINNREEIKKKYNL